MQPDIFNPEPGIAEELEPGLRRVLAPNPSPMTFRGTNTYLLGDRDIAVIDPGPDNPGHMAAILAALRPGQRISHILVTHAHLDHSPLARPLSQATGAPVFAFGDANAGRSAVMEALSARGLAGGGEGVDHAFSPDKTLADGEILRINEMEILALHTPGHFGNHLAFAVGDALFTGDLVMGWASSLVSPPDGDLTDFMASCRKLLTQDWRVFHSGHGAPIQTPMERLNWLISHRMGREAQILEEIAKSPGAAREIAERIYTDTPAALLPAATRNVFAHLVDLCGRGQARAVKELSADATFEAMI